MDKQQPFNSQCQKSISQQQQKSRAVLQSWVWKGLFLRQSNPQQVSRARRNRVLHLDRLQLAM